MPRACVLVAAVLLAACSSLTDRGAYYADQARHAVAQDARVRYLILHYTATSQAESERVLTQGPVSAHYLIDAKPATVLGRPVIKQLVPENRRAWHAGQSDWQGETALNSSSIGIEIVNRGFGPNVDGRAMTPAQALHASESAQAAPAPLGGWQPFTPAQIDAVVRLAKDIVTRYGIEPTHVLAHADIAPQRKVDPGPLFPWHTLAKAGVGAWPDDAAVARYLGGRSPDAPVPVDALQRKLARYGYAIDCSGTLDQQTINVIRAFQMHFRPADYRGMPDAGTAAVLDALLEKYGAQSQGADAAGKPQP